MNSIRHFLRATLIGGVLFVLPLVFVIHLIIEATKMSAALLTPLQPYMPPDRIAGVLLQDALALLAVLVVFFVAGLFVGTKVGRRVSESLEDKVLHQIPGFTYYKTLAQGIVGLDSQLKPALVRLDDSWVLAFAGSRHRSGLYPVYVPGSPTPASGTLCFVTDERIRRLDVPVTKVVSCLLKLGVGADQLLDRAFLEESADETARV
jgi:uncharacterized membrane protein